MDLHSRQDQQCAAVKSVRPEHGTPVCTQIARNGSGNEGGQMADLSITFTNASTATFKRSVYGWEESAVDHTVTLPDTTMKPGDKQVFAVDNQTPVGEGAANFWCCWRHESTSARFGVRINEAGQPFGMGWAPIWRVMSDHAPDGQAPNWSDSGSDPAASYTWDKDVGFDIYAAAVASHEHLSVSVLIRDLPKQK